MARDGYHEQDEKFLLEQVGPLQGAVTTGYGHACAFGRRPGNMATNRQEAAKDDVVDH